MIDLESGDEIAPRAIGLCVQVKWYGLDGQEWHRAQRDPFLVLFEDFLNHDPWAALYKARFHHRCLKLVAESLVRLGGGLNGTQTPALDPSRISDAVE